MIKYNYEISVNDNKARLNKDIFLFRGNRNIHYYFSIKGARFTFSKTNEDLIESSNAIYAAVTVIKPNGVEVANAIAPVEDGVIHLKVTEDLIDEEVEVGDFDLVFDLFDDSEGAVTIPKIQGQFHVQERPCTTSIGTLSGNANIVNQAVVDLATATQENEQLVVVDDNGKYVKTVWKTGDKISVERLNKIEEGLEDVSSQYKDIANLSLTKHTDGKVYIKKQDGTLIGDGIEIGGSDVDLSKITMSMSGQTLKLLNDGKQVATVEIPTAVVTDEQLTSIIQSKIDDGSLSTLSIEDGSIELKKNSWIRFLYYNEVDVNSATDGNWYSDATDSTNTYNNNKISNYIKVNPGDLVNLKNYSKVHFYDINKKYTNGNVFSNKSTWTVPEGIYYLRVQFTNNQVQVYLGDKAHDYDSYHNLYDIQITDNQFIKSIYKNIELGIKKSTINLNDNLSDEYIDIDKLKVLKNFRWAIINPANITHYKKGDYYAHESGIEEVVPGETLYGGSYTITCYDKEKQPLGKSLTYNVGKYIVPNDTFYIKCRLTNSTPPEDFKFTLHRHGLNRNELHSTFVPYDDIVPILRNKNNITYLKNYLGVNELAEKVFLSIGDSFSAPNLWQAEVNKILQTSNLNTARSSATFTYTDGKVPTAYEQIKTYDKNTNIDYIVIAMGTNDKNNSLEIGELSTSLSIDDYNLNTYYGGIQATLNYACNTWPNAIIAIGYTPAGGLGINDTYINPLKKCAELYGVEYIETRYCGYSQYVTNQLDCINGGHPTAKGQVKIGRKMAKIIKNL